MTCKEEALRWIHRYAAGGAALAALPIPGSTSAGLVTLETHMASVIAEIYGESAGAFATLAAGGALTVAGQGLKLIACEAACFIPMLGVPIRMAIAGSTIEALGHVLVAHFERKYPGKPFTKESRA